MAVLTISRDIGSGGLELARRAAEMADYRIADKLVIERIMRDYGFADFDRRYEADVSFWNAEEDLAERALSFLDRVIRAIAKNDRVVIVGRGGFAPLAGFADALHVRATAPFGLRVDRVMRERGIADRADAERFVASRDKARHGFVARYYGKAWEDASFFDLAADVDSFGVAPLAELLAGALERIDAAPRGSPSVLDLDCDALLFDAASRRLAEANAAADDD